MATDQGKNGPEKIVEDWIPDPSRPDIKSVTGFMLGRSDDDKKYRLYLNSSLTHYLDFDKLDTIHAQKLDAQRTVVWLKAASRVRQTNTQSIPVEFLQGQIRRGFLRGASSFANVLMAADCPGSGCAHCTAGCSSLPGGGGSDTAGFTCNC